MSVNPKNVTLSSGEADLVATVQTPGEDEKSWQEEEDRECLNNLDASQYRALVKANYLALDRPEIQYAVKEIRS